MIGGSIKGVEIKEYLKGLFILKWIQNSKIVIHRELKLQLRRIKLFEKFHHQEKPGWSKCRIMVLDLEEGQPHFCPAFPGLYL